jgi:Na+/phosphate symporter
MSPKRKRLLDFKSPKTKASLAAPRKIIAEDLHTAKRTVLNMDKLYSVMIDRVLSSNVPLERKEALLSKIYSELTEDVYHYEKNLKRYGFSHAQNGLLTRLLERKLAVLRKKTHSYPEI